VLHLYRTRSETMAEGRWTVLVLVLVRLKRVDGYSTLIKYRVHCAETVEEESLHVCARKYLKAKTEEEHEYLFRV
jgi:hypothetical protein